jgi:predicted  nucleic acid-binding Zn-ribbon protein
MSMAMLQHVLDQAEDWGQATSLKVQLRDLKDDMALKEALLKSSREQESQNAKDIASLHQRLSRAEEELVGEKEKSSGLEAEKLKLEYKISHLKARAVSDNYALIALRFELHGKTAQLQETQAELQETRNKSVEAYEDMDTTMDDSYRDCV